MEGERMEGYSVVTNDDKHVGHVVGTHGDYYIVESGSILKKTRYPLPKRNATVNSDDGRLVMHMSREILHGAPRVDREGRFDVAAALGYYGD